MNITNSGRKTQLVMHQQEYNWAQNKTATTIFYHIFLVSILINAPQIPLFLSCSRKYPQCAQACNQDWWALWIWKWYSARYQLTPSATKLQKNKTPINCKLSRKEEKKGITVIREFCAPDNRSRREISAHLAIAGQWETKRKLPTT